VPVVLVIARSVPSGGQREVSPTTDETRSLYEIDGREVAV
jgi:hypothetical protein